MAQPGKADEPAKKRQRSRWQRIAGMDKEILDVEGAATVLGVSTSTIYHLAQKGEIPATRVGREWRFSRQNLRDSLKLSYPRLRAILQTITCWRALYGIN